MDTIKLMRWLAGFCRQMLTEVMARNVRDREAELEEAEAEAELIAAQGRSLIVDKGLTMLDVIIGASSGSGRSSR